MSECHLITPVWPDDQPPALPVAIAALLAEGQDRLRIQRERDALAQRKIHDAHEAQRQAAWDVLVEAAKRDLGPGLSEIVNWAMPPETAANHTYSITSAWWPSCIDYGLELCLPAFAPILAAYRRKHSGDWVRHSWTGQDGKEYRWKVVRYYLCAVQHSQAIIPCPASACYYVPDIGLALALAQEAWVEKAKLLCELAK